MPRHTPFHDRVAAANQTGLWSHWNGHLVVERYHPSEKWEYVAIRNAVGMYDASPLFKYRVTGRDAERFLGGVLARDPRQCAPGQAQYTIWCDDRGYVNEDGMLFRLAADDFLLTAAEPNLAYFGDLASGYDVDLADVSDDLAVLAVQGPRSHAVVAAVAPGAADLAPFRHRTATIGGAVQATVSRTGFTGDLGYEIVCDAADALAVWDAVAEAGRGHGLVPFGQTALLMARIEAGLLLVHVDFEASRFAPNDAHRSTPDELGLGWMLRGIDDPTRPFIGRQAIMAERAGGTSRWSMVGLAVDPAAHADTYTAAGLVPPMDHVPIHDEYMVYGDATYDAADQRVGYATSLMYSPVLQRHIALARVRPSLAAPGTRVHLEFTINHAYVQVPATVTRNPMFNPPRKTAPMPAPENGDQR